MKDYMKDVNVQDAIRAGHNDTICWDCQNAMRGGCSWADPDQQTPVDGWQAKKTGIGYIVFTCPKFVRETYGCGRYRTADDYILALETALTERKKQLAKIKNTPNLLRKKNAILNKRNTQLQEELDRELWQAETHMSD